MAQATSSVSGDHVAVDNADKETGQQTATFTAKSPGKSVSLKKKAKAPARSEEEEAASDVEIQTASSLFEAQMKAPVSRGRPQLKNKVLKHLILCESCGGALDYPFVHQRCQHVVCALCAMDNRHSPLCKPCRMSVFNSGNHVSVVTAHPHSARLGDVVAAVGGRDWINHVRFDLDSNNKKAFLQATTVRNEIVRTSNLEYQEAANKTIPAIPDRGGNGGGPRGRHWDDEDYYYSRHPPTRCGGNGICGCCIDILCCCGMCTCCSDMCHRGRRYWKWIFGVFLVFVALAWIAQGINWWFTGASDLNNVIYGGGGTNTHVLGDTPLKPPPQPFFTNNPPRRDL